MSLFASKTPRDLTACGACGSPFINGEPSRRCREWFHEWDLSEHVQHNAPNPILTAFRQDADDPSETVAEVAAWYLEDVDESGRTPAEIDHARRVLSRLAPLA